MTKHERNLAGEPASLPLLCSVSRVAREFDCSKSKVYKMIAAGRLPTVTIDGMVRVRREEVEARCAKNSGSASTGASSSPSAATAQRNSEALSASKRDRIARRRPS
jgi:excisionase family DNA binding protein